MKIKKHVRRGSLAALIALALTSSALAMPTGGEVVRGAGDITVNGGTDFSTIADNATITANNDGQINWQTFNIGAGETLNFAIADKRTLVNQVTGAQASDILGTMNQTSGGGNVVLVNPNGIHIGTSAALNVPDLTLSALSIDQATDTTRVLKAGGGTGALAGQIVVDGGHVTANELNLIGQKVAVADGVVFDMGGTAGTGKAMLQVYATDNAAWTFDGDHMQTKNLTHNAGNDVTFGGTVNMNNATNSSKNVQIGGATTQVKNAAFNGDSIETTAYAASKLSIDERDADRNKHSVVAEATAANTLTADHIQAAGDSLSLGGGAVVLKNSTINVDDVSLDGVAKSATKGDGVRTETLTAPDR
ncbi:filamentous hemagglutinin N-terminal domain-containing protein, partial [uncultured Selenomonas sp.]|uniref:two-partner secretion domain-containing protein n=1 Tax=uncultured Selenomonas sp. TaxID=159275 RepID=UPI0025FBEAAE